MKGYSKGVMSCLIATLSWGIMFPVMGSALLRIDPFTFTSLRYFTAGLAFVTILVWREGWSSLRLSGERTWLARLLGSAGFARFGFLVFLGQSSRVRPVRSRHRS
jgi:drug/metabolite transporter (DMT)-like permease